MALYIAEIVTIVRHKKFHNSFYALFVMRAIPDLLYVLNSFYGNRLPSIIGAVLYPIYSKFPNWMLAMFYFIAGHTFQANNLVTAFILLNRLTTIIMPTKHEMIFGATAGKLDPLVHVVTVQLHAAIARVGGGGGLRQFSTVSAHQSGTRRRRAIGQSAVFGAVRSGLRHAGRGIVYYRRARVLKSGFAPVRCQPMRDPTTSRWTIFIAIDRQCQPSRNPTISGGSIATVTNRPTANDKHQPSRTSSPGPDDSIRSLATKRPDSDKWKWLMGCWPRLTRSKHNSKLQERECRNKRRSGMTPSPASKEKSVKRKKRSKWKNKGPRSRTHTSSQRAATPLFEEDYRPRKPGSGVAEGEQLNRGRQKRRRKEEESLGRPMNTRAQTLSVTGLTLLCMLNLLTAQLCPRGIRVKFGNPCCREQSHDPRPSTTEQRRAVSRRNDRPSTIDEQRRDERPSTIDEQRRDDHPSTADEQRRDERPSTVDDQRKNKRWPDSEERVGKLLQAGDQRRKAWAGRVQRSDRVSGRKRKEEPPAENANEMKRVRRRKREDQQSGKAPRKEGKQAMSKGRGIFRLNCASHPSQLIPPAIPQIILKKKLSTTNLPAAKMEPSPIKHYDTGRILIESKQDANKVEALARKPNTCTGGEAEEKKRKPRAGEEQPSPGAEEAPDGQPRAEPRPASRAKNKKKALLDEAKRREKEPSPAEGGVGQPVVAASEQLPTTSTGDNDDRTTAVISEVPSSLPRFMALMVLENRQHERNVKEECRRHEQEMERLLVQYGQEASGKN
ncbi:hypothetical protein GPALN_013313 [Globodera pallida]|nr:hypothetical protein GPALN_013313 [Globodera pallida]